MTKCPKCDGFTERINFASPGEYLDTVRQLVEVVNQGWFLLVFASCPLQDMFNTPSPGDCIFHHFQCTTCGRGFQLFADTFHGIANWTPGDEQPTN
jgi:hypothetical protein